MLNLKFEIKDLGELRYFLGIVAARSRHEIYICQKKYAIDFLTETGKLGCNPTATPIEVRHGLLETGY